MGGFVNTLMNWEIFSILASRETFVNLAQIIHSDKKSISGSNVYNLNTKTSQHDSSKHDESSGSGHW